MSVLIENDKGHYIVTINGEFYCTCDTYEEAQEEVKTIESEVAL